MVETILRRRYKVPWRHLTARLDPCQRVLVRFLRWKHHGGRAKALTALQDETEPGQLLLDSAPVQAHQHAAGALKKKARKHSGTAAAPRPGYDTRMATPRAGPGNWP